MYYTELLAKIIYWIIIVPFCTSMMLLAAVFILFGVPFGVPYSINWLLEKLSAKLDYDAELAAFLILTPSILGAICGIWAYWYFLVILWSVLISEDYIVFTIAGSLLLWATLWTFGKLHRKKGESVEDTLGQLQKTLRESVKSQEQIQETLGDILECSKSQNMKLIDILENAKSQKRLNLF